MLPTQTSWHALGSIYFAFESLPGIFLEMPPGKKKIGGPEGSTYANGSRSPHSSRGAHIEVQSLLLECGVRESGPVPFSVAAVLRGGRGLVNGSKGDQVAALIFALLCF